MGEAVVELQAAIGQTGGISKSLLQAGLVMPPMHLHTQLASAIVVVEMLAIIAATSILTVICCDPLPFGSHLRDKAVHQNAKTIKLSWQSTRT
jgi:hypothetical protein